MRAKHELDELASGAVSDERLISARKHNMIESVNSGIRMLSLSALALHARLSARPYQTEPAYRIFSLASSCSSSERNYRNG